MLPHALTDAATTHPRLTGPEPIFYPTIEEVAFDWGLSVKINEGNKEVHFYEGRRYIFGCSHMPLQMPPQPTHVLPDPNPAT
jgi:hypothetical protein